MTVYLLSCLSVLASLYYSKKIFLEWQNIHQVKHNNSKYKLQEKLG